MFLYFILFHNSNYQGGFSTCPHPPQRMGPGGAKIIFLCSWTLFLGPYDMKIIQLLLLWRSWEKLISEEGIQKFLTGTEEIIYA